MLVFWSTNSLGSDPVKTEAQEAKQQAKLLPIQLEASIDKRRLPLGHDQMQVTDLSGWAGDRTDPTFGRLVQQIETLATPPWVRHRIAALEADIRVERRRAEHGAELERALDARVATLVASERTLQRRIEELLAVSSAATEPTNKTAIHSPVLTPPADARPHGTEETLMLDVLAVVSLIECKKPLKCIDGIDETRASDFGDSSDPNTRALTRLVTAIETCSSIRIPRTLRYSAADLQPVIDIFPSARPNDWRAFLGLVALGTVADEDKGTVIATLGRSVTPEVLTDMEAMSPLAGPNIHEDVAALRASLVTS